MMGILYEKGVRGYIELFQLMGKALVYSVY